MSLAKIMVMESLQNPLKNLTLIYGLEKTQGLQKYEKNQSFNM